MSFDGLTLTAALIGAGAMALGSAFQAALGFGFALFVVPALALVDPIFLPGPMLLAAVALAAVTALNERAFIDLRLLVRALAGLAVGTAIGALILTAVAGIDLRRVFGGLLLLAVALSLGAGPLAGHRRVLLPAACASGIMGIMAGLHGVTIALAFQSADPKVARATLGAYFTCAYLLAVGVLALRGSFGALELGRTVVLLPGVVAGLALAPLARRHVDRRMLRLAILTVATVSGLILIFK